MPQRIPVESRTFAAFVAAAAALAEDTSVFPDPGARVRRRVEEVEARLAALERKRGFPSRHRTPSNPLP